MKAKLLTMGLIAAAVGMMLISGCESKTEPEVQATEAKTTEAAVEDAAKEAAEDAAAATEQTLCPVMKAPINKDLFVEYEGKKVYFCCPGCEETFMKDPAKYVKDLPQFQE